jgi:hypothetical protein
MNKLTTFLINRLFAVQIGDHNIRNILSKVMLPGFLALCAYSNTSLAAFDYHVWYDSEAKQEHQIYNGNSMLIPPSWACARKFSNPSYYRHLDNYYNTLDSANFWKDIYVWIPKPGCPYTSESFIEYVDGSQSFAPTIGAIAIEISTNYSSRWVDKNGRWPFCQNCTGPSSFAPPGWGKNWGKIVGEIAILKSAIIKKDFVKFDNAVARVNSLLSSFEKEMDSGVREANLKRSKEDKHRLANIEEDALNQLSMARKQLGQCVRSANSTRAPNGAYRSCDLALKNLQHFKSLWMSRD